MTIRVGPGSRIGLDGRFLKPRLNGCVLPGPSEVVCGLLYDRLPIYSTTA